MVSISHMGYHVKNIRISGYNSKANGIVEQSHFDVHRHSSRPPTEHKTNGPKSHIQSSGRSASPFDGGWAVPLTSR